MPISTDPLTFSGGATMKNRFMLAPLTNSQSYEDGKISAEEFHWLTMRAKGQFGLVMTCASHVQPNGRGFPGQLGIFGDQHLPGLTKLAKAIRTEGSLAVAQLYHGGMRCPADLIGQAPVSPSDVDRKGARALRLEEIHGLRDNFIDAAKRAKKAGFDGVEIHGAHGYIIAQFLSEKINVRSDEYGGSLDNRSRLLFEIIDGIRSACGKDFLLGVRLSPERFGMKLSEIKEVCQRIISGGKVDFLDMSLWDCYKLPEEEEHRHKSLLHHFTDMEFGKVKLTVAGGIRSGQDVRHFLDAGVDFVTVGRGAILHHNFPERVMNNPEFEPINLPVTTQYLKKEGLSAPFIQYMRRWEGFVV